MGTHYICTGGCGGVAETPGMCQATDCADHGKPLHECNCTDGSHGEADASLEENAGEAEKPSL